MISIDLSPLIINLDPAVFYLPYIPDLDIREIINYKEIMKKNNLGPNGAIMTCLNIFASKIDILVNFIISEKNKKKQIFIIDTPGQIEVFNWSASGQIISSTLASLIPTSVVFVADSVRCENPNTFMSNMLFCCSVLFKLKLPIVILFNKSDMIPKEKRVLHKWLADYEIFLNDLKNYKSNYLSSFSRSLCFALDDFYKDLKYFFISCFSGEGLDEFHQSFELLRQEYFNCYYNDLKSNMEKMKINKLQEQNQPQFIKDLDKNN